jgi:AraC family transcriptional regulator
MAPSARINWEFYAVIAGRCAPWFDHQAKPQPTALRSETLWLFPPECVHGWIGERRRCRVAVFHFDTVPAVLAERVRSRGWLQHALCPTELRRIETLTRELMTHYESPTQLSLLYIQKAMLELSLLAFEGAAAARVPTHATLTQQKVESAITFYQEHLGENPSMTDIARKVGVSGSHLRRLFALTKHESPKHAFRRVAMERATALLSQTDLTLEAIASQCGFAGASEFNRAFKREFKVPPGLWRQGILPPYQKPVTVHGRLQLPQDHDQVVRKLRRYGAVSNQ